MDDQTFHVTSTMIALGEPNPITARVWRWVYSERMGVLAYGDAPHPPCTRDGEPSERVLATLAFASGVVFARSPGEWVEWMQRIASADDSKGWLTVTLIAPVPAPVLHAIRAGWAAVGNEPRENVTFELMTLDEISDHEAAFWRKLP